MGLATAGWPKQKDVAFCEFDLVAAGGAEFLLILNTAVVVVNRHRHHALGLILTDHVFIQE